MNQVIELTFYLYAIFAGSYFFTLAAVRRLRHWRASDIKEAEREALDSTVRWAYMRGWMDGASERDVEAGVSSVAMDFRAVWGDERREVCE